MEERISAQQIAVKKTIKTARKAARYSQDWLAELVGVTQQAVSQWEQTGVVAQEHWPAIREHLGVDVGEIMAREYLVSGMSGEQSGTGNIGGGNILSRGGQIRNASFIRGEILTAEEQAVVNALRSIEDKAVAARIARKLLGMIDDLVETICKN